MKSTRLKVTFGYHLLRFRNGLGWVQSFGARVRAVHDRVAAIQTEWIFQFIQALAGHLVTAVR